MLLVISLFHVHTCNLHDVRGQTEFKKKRHQNLDIRVFSGSESTGHITFPDTVIPEVVSYYQTFAVNNFTEAVFGIEISRKEKKS